MDSSDLDIERLYADHGAAIFRFCFRLCGNRARAEDLAQDTFVAAMRAKDRFRQAASPKTWLYGIALNLTRRSRRRQAVERWVSWGSGSRPADPEGSIRFRMAYAGVALAAALTVGVLLLPVRSTAQTAYRRMIAGTRRVDAVHLVVRWRPGNGRVEDGPMRKVYELWWRPGAWREQGEDLRPSIKREESGGLMFYRVDPKTGEVKSYHEVVRPLDYRIFDLVAFAGRYMNPPVKFAQPSANRIVTTNAGDWSRMIFTIEPKTGLPTHAEKQSRYSRSAWTSAGTIDLEFDGPLPEDRFEPGNLVEKAKP